VKIDPKAIGVGQYQHDVHQPTLQKALDGVVESCVNRVGVDVNTASFTLLRYVAGWARRWRRTSSPSGRRTGGSARASSC